MAVAQSAPSSQCRHLNSKLTRALLIEFVEKCLNQEERLVLMLHYCEGLSMEEIAGVLHLDVNEVGEIHDTVLSRTEKQFLPSLKRGTLVA